MTLQPRKTIRWFRVLVGRERFDEPDEVAFIRSAPELDLLDLERIDGRAMAKLLDSIPGAPDRIALAREQIARGGGIPLDEL